MKKFILIAILCQFFILSCNKAVKKIDELDFSIAIQDDTVHVIDEIKEVVVDKVLEEAVELLPERYDNVEINEYILFDFDSYEIRSEYAELINDIKYSYGNHNIVLVGSACEIGDEHYNYDLGLKRARAVAERLGLDCEVQSVGETTKYGELGKNRRCVITIK
jgi:outer membrane protein OmpA-like peptidoglycan-associated protein